MEKHIADIAIDNSCEDGKSFITMLKSEDIEAAKQIIDILEKTKLPICISDNILDFCKYAIQFSGIALPGKI